MIVRDDGQGVPDVDEIIGRYRRVCDEIVVFRDEQRLREFVLLGQRADALRALVEYMPKRTAAERLGISAVHVGRMLVEDMTRRAMTVMRMVGVEQLGVGAYQGGRRVGIVVGYDSMADYVGNRDRVVDASTHAGLQLLWVADADQSSAAHCAKALEAAQPGRMLVEYVFIRHDRAAD